MIKNKKSLVVWLTGAGTVFFVLSTFFIFNTSETYAQSALPSPSSSPSPAPAGDPNEESDSDDTTCAIEKVGWILCPVIESSSWIGDQAFSYLAKFFLETEPELVADKSGTRDAWELARNIANLMFIIAFLIIIFSQVTGRGLNNYGIKKMLPRLIIAAIAVNVSYYICQLMVDLSNVLGYELMNFLVGISQDVSTRSAMPIQTSIDNQTSAGTLGAIAIGVLAVGSVLVILPMLLSTIVTIAVVGMLIALILLLRKAIIVLLVVASPIAFVAYILPNTEKFFQKWLSMFWKLLMVFPVVGLLMGGGQLASAIVLAAGTSSDNNSVYADDSGKCIQLPTNNPDAKNAAAEARPCGDGSTPFLLGLAAAAIAVAPLIAVWSVLKGALAATGAIGGAIQTYGNRFNGNMRNRAKKAEGALRGAAGQAITTNALNGGFGRRPAGFVRRRQLGKQRRESALEAAKAGYDATDPGAVRMAKDTLTNKMAENAAKGALQSEFIRNVASGEINVGQAALGMSANNQSVASALEAQQTKAVADAIKEVQLSSTIAPGDIASMGREFEKAIAAGDSISARAYQNMLLSSGGAGQTQFHNSTRNAYRMGAMGSTDASGNFTESSMSQSLRQNILSNFGSIKDSDASIGDWATQKGKGGALERYQSNQENSWSGLTAAQFAGLSKQAQSQAAPHMSANAKADLQKAENAQLLARVSDDARSIAGL